MSKPLTQVLLSLGTLEHIQAERLAFTDTESNNMKRPNIQIDELVREMTEEEYADLVATGWTLESKDETPTSK